ncbi:MAG: hypothetical protein KF716_14985 [Anaerolineae bacterium]|nr:hypothetical protein [Anaerolineae bacterium]
MLKDLNLLIAEIRQQLENDFDPLWADIPIPDNLPNDPLIVKHNEYSVVLNTGNRYVYAPSQWFILAYHLSAISSELDSYKTHFEQIFAQLQGNAKDELAKRARTTHSITDEERSQIESHFQEAEDRLKFIKWLTDYGWWNGEKTVDRPDFDVSPLLTIAKVPQASQSYLINLTRLVYSNPNFREELGTQLQKFRLAISTYSPTQSTANDMYRQWHQDLVKAGYSLPQIFSDTTYSEIEPDPIDFRLALALQAKPFLIFTGLAGSGKTKIAQAFAHWISQATMKDPFVKGTTIAADNVEYAVIASDSIGIEVQGGSKQLIPRRLVEEWASFILAHDLRDTSSQDIRDKMATVRTRDSDFLRSNNNFHAPLKAAALHLLNLRDSGLLSQQAFRVIPVGADWTNRDPIFGYYDLLNNKYRTEPALDLILQAKANPDIPHFLILDEMNLSHVERYFADILSAMESGEAIFLHEDAINDQVPAKITLPANLFIIGTVNIDETTYMFSPKVLDRANVLEFRATAEAMDNYIAGSVKLDLDALNERGRSFATQFVRNSLRKVSLSQGTLLHSKFREQIKEFFEALAKYGMEFGFRTASEIERYIVFHFEASGQTEDDYVESTFSKAFDAQIIQKLLPRLNGSRRKLEPALLDLIDLCKGNAVDGSDTASNAIRRSGSLRTDILNSTDTPDKLRTELSQARYPLSYEKLIRMLIRIEDGFTSFAEA